MSNLQNLRNQQGEVNFRRKLAKQFAGQEVMYPGEPSYKQNLSIIRGRVKDYKRYFKSLISHEMTLEPYLEIGSGIGQGAMFLEDQYKTQGFATDISYDTLLLANHYKDKLHFKKMPFRVCCDVYNLPFKTNSLPFIFTVETLHHFPDPKPVLEEIYRVLAPGGYFYFNEEPVAQMINLNLWQRDRNLRWFEKILRSLLVLHFISKIGKSEIENNILEEAFSLKTWEKTLNVFDAVQATLKAFPYGPISVQIKTPKKGWPQYHPVRGWLNPPLYKNILLQILGGGIEALCKKSEKEAKPPIQKNVVQSSAPHNITSENFYGARQTPSESRGRTRGFFEGGERLSEQKLFELLACPNCKQKPGLNYHKSTKTLSCPICKTTYKSKNGIFMLFSREQMAKLYPEKVKGQKSKVKISS
ncbi:methyltransferase domain-containing protein [Candidatus Daviesbacteria bacterium]|nr:methyltransferase domain-containing protein [Candidatus Daviesbacteria bacterium]